MAKAKKAKKVNPKAARPAKKAPIRKAAKKPQPIARKKAATSKTAVKKVVATKTAKKPKAKPVSRRPKTASAAATPAAATIAPASIPPAPVATPPETPLAPPAKPPLASFSSPVSAPPQPGTPDLLADNDPLARKKGVRKATITSGLQDPAAARRLGRSRIPVDAPLDVVFQNDTQAREAFSFLGIHSIRELESFTADDLVLRLTGPAKLTVGRIRKILAMNNRCLTGDEDFAVDFQEQQRNPARGDL